jgi:fatty acid desaturase
VAKEPETLHGKRGGSSKPTSLIKLEPPRSELRSLAPYNTPMSRNEEKPKPRQFTIRHLFALTTSIAIVLVFFMDFVYIPLVILVAGTLWLVYVAMMWVVFRILRLRNIKP